MSVSHPDNLSFRIRGGDALTPSYDEQADILYLWIGPEPRPAVSVTSKEGHLVRIDPATREIVGFTVFDFCRVWQQDDPCGELDITVTTPAIGGGGGDAQEASELHLIPA